MTYRYTESEYQDILKRQSDNLSTFQRNSGRGLPPETLDAMEKAAGVQMDDNGAPVPLALTPLPAKVKTPKAKRSKAVKMKVPTEHEECRWLIDWAKTQRFNGWPLSDILVHVPNGAFHGRDRTVGAVIGGKLRAQGMQAGVYDYILPVPLWTKKCPGLWLEMKRTHGGVVSDEQKEFQARMLQLGWQCEVAKGWVEASAIITQYLKSVTPR
jgi:hypothetical protein